MVTFIIGIAILLIGGFLYGGICEKVFSPDDRKTPAFVKEDNVDFVPLKKWKNCLVNLLNIAGTGPILGPIQGILFGPIAFITIPLGCVLCGAVHDYSSGMICTREGGIQMPEMIRRFHSKGVYVFFTIFILLTLFLCGVVFVYTPGDIAATQLFGFGGNAEDVSTWIIYGVIFLYYIIATVLPIDKIIGKVYPVFGALLIISAVGIFLMLIITGSPLCEIWGSWELGSFDFGAYFRNNNFIPVFFVTVACGIMSGFHSSQTALISRTLQNEKHGRMTFYNMMLCEGFIAMVWAAGTMTVIGIGAQNAGITMEFIEGEWCYRQSVAGGLQTISPTSVVGVICKNMLGDVGGIIAIIGVIVLPVSTGDTAFRSLRLMIAETFHIKQETVRKRMTLAFVIFTLAVGLLIWAKTNSDGFNIIWRYFGWANQTLSIFVTSSVIVYLVRAQKTKFVWIPAIPFVFYSFIVASFLASSKLGFSLDIVASYIIGAVFAILCFTALLIKNKGKTLKSVK